MLKQQKIHFSWRSMAMICALGLMFMVAACGQSSGSAGSSGNTGSVPPDTTPEPTIVKGYGTSQGCPSDLVVASTPTKANVVVQVSGTNNTITAHTGDIIEAHLPFGQRWTGPTTSVGVLQLQDPYGYAQKSDHACIWRFQAKTAGSANLSFTGRAICSPGKMCPMYVEDASFTVDIK